MWQDNKNKAFFQNRLRPATHLLARVGITPNQITATTIMLSLTGGAIVTALPDQKWPLLLIPGVLSLRVAFNHIDGMLACEFDMKTPLGAMLNELADVISDAALYLPLALIPGVSAALLVPVVVLGILTEMVGVVATRIGAERREDGPLSKKPRGLIIGGVALALGLGAMPGVWLTLLFAAMLPLLIATLVARVNGALKEANGRCSPI